MIDTLAIVFGCLSTIAGAFFTWRGKREDTNQKNNETIRDMFSSQAKLIKEFSKEIEILTAKVDELKAENHKLLAENESLKDQITTLTEKIEKLALTD